MSREIEFRAWAKPCDGEGVMISDIHLSTDFGKIVSGCYKLTDYKVMQYTGLKDVNGVKIFEGDIVEDDEYYRSAIYWDANGLMFCATDVGGLIDMCAPIKVIGNIHQHPHLLEAK